MSKKAYASDNMFYPFQVCKNEIKKKVNKLKSIKDRDKAKNRCNVPDPEYLVQVGDKFLSGKWYSKSLTDVIRNSVLFPQTFILLIQQRYKTVDSTHAV